MSRLGRAQPIPPVVLHGFLGNTPANFTTPTPILVVENVDRRRRYPPLDPFSYNSALAAVSQPLPPPPVIVENLDRRRKYPSLDPFVYDSALAASGQNTGGFFRLM